MSAIDDDSKLDRAYKMLHEAKQYYAQAKRERDEAKRERDEALLKGNADVIADAMEHVKTATALEKVALAQIVTVDNHIKSLTTEDLVSTVSGKRKSLPTLPTPKCASKWTVQYLDKLKISIIPETQENVIMGYDRKEDEKLPPLSDRANLVAADCVSVLDAVGANVYEKYELVALGHRVGGAAGVDHRTRNNVGWLLLKYISLIIGSSMKRYESVVDDFLIQLLGALGYNDGDLVILSKNQLSMRMNGSDQSATADITVYDVIKRFRLVVMEEKSYDSDMKEDYEAQLVAEAVAAIQANMFEAKVNMEPARKRTRSASEGDVSDGRDCAASASASATVGLIYLIRVVGVKFSFYSMNPSICFMNIFRDYSQRTPTNPLPETIVQKCSITLPSSTTPINQFSFIIPEHRHVIITMLDWIRTRITM